MEIIQKREFLEWFLKSVPVATREILWILNYIANHDAILEKVHIVEQVDKTPRGILFVSTDITHSQSISLYKDGKEFVDVNQIFHEIRMHADLELFLEFKFLNAWKTSTYLEVLEDNPYSSWNEKVEESKDLEEFLEEEAKAAQIKALTEQIDQALAKQDEENFARLSRELIELKKQ